MIHHTYTYHLNEPNKKYIFPRYSQFHNKLTAFFKDKHATNEREYNALLKTIYTHASSLNIPQTNSKLFRSELALIHKKKPLTETTTWGGVTLKKVDVDKDFIQKLLVIKKNGVLGFEIHKKKNEQLRVIEGFCLVFGINHKGKPNNVISLQLAGPHDTFTFAPNDEHGILTVSNCIIEEASTNHLDDLVYIFHARL